MGERDCPWKGQLSRPGRTPAVVLVQVREDDRGHLGGRRSGRREPVAELADERLNSRTVAKKARTEPGVDDCVAIGGLDEQAVVTAGDGRPVQAFGRQRLVQFKARYPGTRCEERVDRRFPRWRHLPVADNRAVDPSDGKAINHRPIVSQAMLSWRDAGAPADLSRQCADTVAR